MTRKSKTTKILLDADVIRHFISGGHLDKLVRIYPKRLVIIDVVKHELLRSRSLYSIVSNFINMFNIEQYYLTTKRTDIFREYVHLQSQGFGDGECACMAVAKFDKHFIASSNLRDIKQYCKENNITYLTTMHILVEAQKQGIMTEAECNLFISKVKGAGSKLPTNTLQEYLSM